MLILSSFTQLEVLQPFRKFLKILNHYGKSRWEKTDQNSDRILVSFLSPRLPIMNLRFSKIYGTAVALRAEWTTIKSTYHREGINSSKSCISHVCKTLFNDSSSTSHIKNKDFISKILRALDFEISQTK